MSEQEPPMAMQLSAHQVLSLTKDERVLFVKQNLRRTQDGALDIRNIDGLEDLSEAWRPLLGEELIQAEFRVWQLRNRHRRPAFDEYPEEHRRDFLMHGEIPKSAAKPDFEQAARRLWEREYDYGQQSQQQLDGDGDGDGIRVIALSRHSEKVGKRLADRGFAQPSFQLLADPKRQDQWTTYVEYLAFESSSLRKLDITAQRLQEWAKEQTDGHEDAVGRK
ncbi:hypothetical protein B0H63DRAFT_563730 [Podospora didyma]|uniref:Uncharacterized protein n=1 Tax=Podospora didyma TaxID=330526 RepID=A0AAE0KA81_9PEZI|nr:hypothetical protein B0H63DRAFT_563730 [Podospora didyma]